MIRKNYYQGEPVNILVQSLINIIQEKNWAITTKKGKGKLPLLCGNGEQVIPIYASKAGILDSVRELSVPMHLFALFTFMSHRIWNISGYFLMVSYPLYCVQTTSRLEGT